VQTCDDDARMRFKRLARVGLTSLVGAVAWSAPTVTHAQGVGAGKTLELPLLGARFQVPAGVGEWITRQDAGGDVVQRTRPADPYLSVLFSVPDDDEATCERTLAAFARKGLHKLDRQELAPAGWSREVLSASSGGQKLLAFCADGEPPLLALVTYAGDVDDADLAAVTPLLAAVGKGFFAPPPASARRLTLASSQLTLVVEDDWEALPDRDEVRRRGGPALSVAFELVPGGKDCDALRGRGRRVLRPPYLPDGFGDQAIESYSDGHGRARACAEVPAGRLVATLVYDGSLADADVRAARPLLRAAYEAASALPGTRAHPVLSGHSFYSPELVLGAQRIVPVGVADDGNGVLLSVRQAGLWHLSPRFGLAGRFHFAGGWDVRHQLSFDGSLAIGVGVALGPVVLMPMLGGGADAIGAGADPADDRLQLDFHLYDWLGGVVEVAFSPRLALELTGAYGERGARSEWRSEARVLVLPASFRKLSLGLSYLKIEEVATLWQLLLGVGF
jgi:hypothetical protein